MAWLNGWSHRKRITLKRESAAVTDYQMKLLLGESVNAINEDVDCNALCAADFSDVRFTAENGTTLLSYWIESISGTTPNQLAIVWIKFDYIGTGDTTFYMYYGNAGATTVSSGVDTFIFFDDFTGTTLDTTTNWTLDSGSVVIGSSILKLVYASSPNWGNMHSKNTFAVNNRLRCSMLYGVNSSYMCFGFSDLSSYANLFYSDHPSSNVLNATNRNPYPTQTSQNLGNIGHGAYNVFEIKRNSTTNVIYLINDSVASTLATNVYTGALPINIFAQEQDVYSKWVFVSQYLDTEPTWGIWGDQEDFKTFYYEGYVNVQGVPAARKVHLHRRSTGELVDSTTSSGTTGYFKLQSIYSDYHYVIVLSDINEGFSLLFDDKIHPEI
jgi:hypothetical protein